MDTKSDTKNPIHVERCNIPYIKFGEHRLSLEAAPRQASYSFVQRLGVERGLNGSFKFTDPDAAEDNSGEVLVFIKSYTDITYGREYKLQFSDVVAERILMEFTEDGLPNLLLTMRAGESLNIWRTQIVRAAYNGYPTRRQRRRQPVEIPREVEKNETLFFDGQNLTVYDQSLALPNDPWIQPETLSFSSSAITSPSQRALVSAVADLKSNKANVGAARSLLALGLAAKAAADIPSSENRMALRDALVAARQTCDRMGWGVVVNNALRSVDSALSELSDMFKDESDGVSESDVSVDVEQVFNAITATIAEAIAKTGHAELSLLVDGAPMPALGAACS